MVVQGPLKLVVAGQIIGWGRVSIKDINDRIQEERISHLQTAALAMASAPELRAASFDACSMVLSSTVSGGKTSATRRTAWASVAVMGVPDSIIFIACGA